MLTSLLRFSLIRVLLGSAGLRIVGMVLTIVVSITLARLLGPGGMGFYAFAMAVVSIAGLPVQLGVPVLVLRETAAADKQQAWGRMRGIWVWALRRIAIGAALVLPVLALGGWLLEGRVVPEGGLGVLWMALPLVPLIALAQLRGSALRGLEHPLLGQVIDGVFRPAVMLALVLGVSLLWQVDAELAVLGQVIAALLAFGLGSWLLLRVSPAGMRDTPGDLSERAAWARAVWPLALISGVQILMQNVNIVLLGAFAAPEEVGVFRIAVSASNLALFGLGVVNFILAPRFARLHADMAPDRMARTAQRGAAVSVAAALPVAALLVLAGPWILALLYGEGFAGAYLPMAILVGAQLINAFFGSCGNVLNMTGHERDSARALVFGLGVNLGLNLALVPVLGGVGAALATLGSTLTWNLLMERTVRRKLGFTSSALGLLQSRARA